MLINDDILNWCKAYTGPKFHALLCDPPYHLTEITDRFGKPDSAQAQYGRDGAFQRVSKGFMGRDWDGGDVAFRSETWAAIAEHLYPGAWGMAFASTRGWHRMAVAIEDAGLLIQPVIGNWVVPMLLGYAFGSGFPKATNIATQIDEDAFREWLKDNPSAELNELKEDARTAVRNAKKHDRISMIRAVEAKKAYTDARRKLKERAGFARIVGTKQQTGSKFKLTQSLVDNGGFNDPDRSEYEITEGATELAQAWEGHRYGGQALKPAFEPIIVFQKPYEGRAIECMTETGAGALWIEGARISGAGAGWNGLGHTHDEKLWRLNNPDEIQRNPNGRWPANLILTHLPECDEACADGCSVQRLGEQSGILKSGKPSGRRNASSSFLTSPGGSELSGFGDEGTASRFFYQADWSYEIAERLAGVDPVFYCAKASSAERDAGLETFPPVVIDDGREKSIDNAYQRGETSRRNPHPTLKPIRLTQHLATLLLPPAMYAPRRILVPFAGVGSEYIGAMKAGWEEIVGVELTSEYIPYAEARITYWRGHDAPSAVSERQKQTETTDDRPVQASLFDEAA